jgi:hypothetical protein
MPTINSPLSYTRIQQKSDISTFSEKDLENGGPMFLKNLGTALPNYKP